jgi:hypothetical protein
MLRTPLRLCTFHNRVMPAGTKNYWEKKSVLSAINAIYAL